MSQREVRTDDVRVSVSFVSRPEIRTRYGTASPCLFVPVFEFDDIGVSYRNDVRTILECIRYSVTIQCCS